MFTLQCNSSGVLMLNVGFSYAYTGLQRSLLLVEVLHRVVTGGVQYAADHSRYS